MTYNKCPIENKRQVEECISGKINLGIVSFEESSCDKRKLCNKLDR